MDLSYNARPSFTQWALREGLLSSPLVLLDVGVQGGINPRWELLGDLLAVHGFDALEEAISPLRAENKPNRIYHAIALGDEDGERDIFLTPNLTASSMYGHGQSRYNVSESVARSIERRRVPIRRLDSLLAEGTIRRPDVLKIDCEGFEPEILRGARELLRSGVLAVEVETNFNISPLVPGTHFAAVYDQLLPYGFLLYDLAFDRTPRTTFVRRARALGIRKPSTVARPSTFNVLFYRETEPSDADETLRRATVLELYGMADNAYDVLMDNAAMFSGDFRLEAAADRLLRGQIAQHPDLRSAVRASVAAIGSAARSSITYRLRRGIERLRS